MSDGHRRVIWSEVDGLAEATAVAMFHARDVEAAAVFSVQSRCRATKHRFEESTKHR
jgi:hypothetical protein